MLFRIVELVLRLIPPPILSEMVTILYEYEIEDWKQKGTQ
jgi:L-cystine uptake protein TcyP (sodium:dicarboxylate symporter family)